MPFGSNSPIPAAPTLRLLTLSLVLLVGCGGGGTSDGAGGGGGGSGSGGLTGGGPGGGGGPIEGPPDLDDMEGFGVWPGGAPSAATSSAPERLRGIVGYRNSPRLASMYADAGAAGGLYRRTWTLHEPSSGDFIHLDFLRAKQNGMRLWLHVVGTPADLSPHPELTNNSYGTGLPEYARFPPTDPIAWADRVVAKINSIELSQGVVPEYVEIWNEVERVEWFTGTAEELLDMYQAVATRIRALRPDVKVGGPALAGWRSAMGGTESVVLQLIRRAAATGTPLDFVSWHHYAPANEMLLSDMPAVAKALADDLGIGPIETIVSEWNIAPSAEGALGPEFDGAHAAANYAGFLTTARERGLDGSMFFLDVDEDDAPGIIDLAGVSLGALTLHGVKKPIFRVMEEAFGMMAERTVPVFLPEEEEYNLRVMASRNTGRTRVLVSNDVVTSTWMFVNKARQHGMEPSWLNGKLAEANGPRSTVPQLMAVGLTQAQAEATVAFMPLVIAASRMHDQPRETVLTVLGEVPFAVGRVVRFDSVHNDPADHRAEILPHITAAANGAIRVACEQTSAFLAGWGWNYTVAELVAVPENQFLSWAAAEGIPFGIASSAFRLLRDTKRNERFAQQELLNSLEETRLQEQTAAQAGITVTGRKISFTLEPDAVIVLDLIH